MKVHAQPNPTPVDEDIYRLLVSMVPDYAIFLLDPDGYVRSWNLGAERIKGYRPEEIIGHHFSEFYPRERVEQGWPEHELEVAKEVGRFEDEGWRVRKDGTTFWANVVITRVNGDDGRLLGFSKITRDLTARRQHEDLLRRSEERFRLLVDSVRDYAIFMLDPEGHVVSWNLGAERTKGYRADEIIGRHFSVFYPDEVANSGWPARELELALRDGRFEDEGWRLRKDGARFWASVILTPIYNEAGRHIGFAKVTRDLTDKRRVVTLEDESRRMTTFLAMLGHELRNPLAPIANAVSIMQMETLESDRLRLCRDVITRQVGQMTRLVDDLLDVARITHGKVRLDMQPVEVGALAAEMVEAFEAVAREREQTLLLVRPPTLAWVNADRARLLQIGTNLLGNATRFTPRGGRIVVTVSRSEGHVELSVRDNGPGIAPDRTDEIFQPFVQVSRDPGRAQGGLGLGLSLVQQLVAAHGGYVSVFSTGESGQGAEFVVRLPRVASPIPQQPSNALGLSVSPRRILIVDDNSDAADTLAALLRSLGHDAQAVYDGAAGLQSAAQVRPDLIFLDIGLPDIDGLELARRLRAAFKSPPPMIALTGYGQASDREAALAAGFYAHLTKPLSPTDLGMVLSELFDPDPALPNH